MDGNGYLFIADKENHRIVGSGPNEFRCLIGCTESGSANNQLINDLKYSNGNQNLIRQILFSISQQINEINQKMIEKAVLNEILATSIFTSPLGSELLPQNISNSFDESALLEYQKQLIIQTNLREYLIQFISNLTIYI